MFSVINGVLLAPLPFSHGDELVLVQQSAVESGRDDVGVSIQELADYRSRLESVRDLVEYHTMSFTLLDQGEPDRVDTGVVSANFSDMLGVQPVFGRLAPGATVEGASEEIATVAAPLEHDYPQDYEAARAEGITGERGASPAGLGIASSASCRPFPSRSGASPGWPRRW